MKLCRLKNIKRKIFCACFLILSLVLAAFGFIYLVFVHQDLQKHLRSAHRPRHRLSYSSDLEVILDSQNTGTMQRIGVSHLTSLLEDQLLFVASAQHTNVSPAHLQKKGNNRMAMSDAKKYPTVPILATDGYMKRPVEGQERNVKLLSVQNHGFNKVVNDRISLHRQLPEARHISCLGGPYSETLPSASVVICFHDETWTTLLRTVHSVLDTSPKEHLLEILLVDDFSQQGRPKSALSDYIAHLHGVRLIHSTHRLGVAGCRSMGATRAAGEVLVFMDSNCVCHRGWLEPLLERVAQDRTGVVSPVMDVLDRHTFQYNATPWPVRGVFDWRLEFHWELMPQFLNKKHGSSVQPLRSPALGGGVLAIDRHLFKRVGAYDPGMLLCGAEHIELSIRVWLCGGFMEVVPCSRVAHLGGRLPFPSEEILEKNKNRIAETWLDAYRKIYYRRDTLAHFIRQSEKPNITERVRLKRRLGCGNFRWFLNNVYPELYVPRDRPGLSGELYNIGTGYCADYSQGEGPQTMTIAPCSGKGNQHCELNSVGEVHWGPAGAFCFNTLGDMVVLTPCSNLEPRNRNLQWEIIKLTSQLVHLETQLCLEGVKDGGGPQDRDTYKSREKNTTGVTGLFLRHCAPHPGQKWHFEQLVVP